MVKYRSRTFPSLPTCSPKIYEAVALKKVYGPVDQQAVPTDETYSYIIYVFLVNVVSLGEDQTSMRNLASTALILTDFINSTSF